jgi:type VI secretion system Hcp family effector
MALEGYLSIKGSKQGTIKGGSTKKGKGDTSKFPILYVDLGFGGSYALGLGKHSGKHHHHPIKVVREIDWASHQIFRAGAAHEILENVTIHFSRGDQRTYIVKLTKALIVRIMRTSFPGVNAPCEQLEFSYEEMEITIDYSSHDGKER